MKKGIKFVLAILGVAIVGVGLGWSSGSPRGIRISEGAKYQYQVIDPEDIIIEYSGLKPDISLSKYKGRYVFDTTAYLTDLVGVYLGDNHFEATVPELVKYSDINWKWNISNVELYNLMVNQGSANTEFFEGTIDYTDGNQINVKPDSVSLKSEAGYMVVEVSFKGSIIPYKVKIKDIWGDGESLTEEEIEKLKVLESEQEEVEEVEEEEVVKVLKDEEFLSSLGITKEYITDYLESIGTSFPELYYGHSISDVWEDMNIVCANGYGIYDWSVIDREHPEIVVPQILGHYNKSWGVMLIYYTYGIDYYNDNYMEYDPVNQTMIVDYDLKSKRKEAHEYCDNFPWIYKYKLYSTD